MITGSNPTGIHGCHSFDSVDCCLVKYCDGPISQPDALYCMRLPVCVCVCLSLNEGILFIRHKNVPLRAL
jgi:hypothetical protein